MPYPGVTLAGVSLTRAQAPLPYPQPFGKVPREEFTTRDSSTEGARRVWVPHRFHQSFKDIEFNCTITDTDDFDTLNTSFENAHNTVTLIVGGTTYTCLWAEDGFQPERVNINTDYRRVRIKLHVLASA